MNAKVLRLMRKHHGIPLRRQHEVLPPEVLVGIERGLADLEAGRVITLEEFIKQHSLDRYARMKNPRPHIV